MEYSSNETKLIKYYGLGYIIPVQSIHIDTMIKFMVYKAFIDNDQSPAAEALRRILKLWETDSSLRGSKEWEDACKF